MKRIYYILLSLVIIGFNSCDDMLDLRPISEQTTGNFYENQAHMESAVAAMYNGLRDYHTDDKYRMAMCPADNIEVGGAGYDEGPGGITKYITLSSNFVILDYWQEAYSSIHRCNVVIERAEGVEYDDTDLKTQHIAEARFVRGLIYYDLVRFFAGVPLITESLPLEQYYEIPRSTADDIWNFAQQDPEFAAANLPAEIDGNGRANKFSALGIL
ncbi:MAG: RagB/SusD family nutrient uptake outer membrane protein, partial [Bacteroidales bacterium]|nr:RagB/SusD family nutrient uptake outer membrane protein [Bacteroidales bacterium]